MPHMAGLHGTCLRCTHTLAASDMDHMRSRTARPVCRLSRVPTHRSQAHSPHGNPAWPQELATCSAPTQADKARQACWQAWAELVGRQALPAPSLWWKHGGRLMLKLWRGRPDSPFDGRAARAEPPATGPAASAPPAYHPASSL